MREIVLQTYPCLFLEWLHEMVDRSWMCIVDGKQETIGRSVYLRFVPGEIARLSKQWQDNFRCFSLSIFWILRTVWVNMKSKRQSWKVLMTSPLFVISVLMMFHLEDHCQVFQTAWQLPTDKLSISIQSTCEVSTAFPILIRYLFRDERWKTISLSLHKYMMTYSSWEMVCLMGFTKFRLTKGEDRSMYPRLWTQFNIVECYTTLANCRRCRVVPCTRNFQNILRNISVGLHRKLSCIW